MQESRAAADSKGPVMASVGLGVDVRRKKVHVDEMLTGRESVGYDGVGCSWWRSLSVTCLEGGKWRGRGPGRRVPSPV